MPVSRLGKWKAAFLLRSRENEFHENVQHFSSKFYFEVIVPLMRWRFTFTDTRYIILALPLIK